VSGRLPSACTHTAHCRGACKTLGRGAQPNGNCGALIILSSGYVQRRSYIKRQDQVRSARLRFSTLVTAATPRDRSRSCAFRSISGCLLRRGAGAAHVGCHLNRGAKSSATQEGATSVLRHEGEQLWLSCNSRASLPFEVSLQSRHGRLCCATNHFAWLVVTPSDDALRMMVGMCLLASAS